MGQSLHNCNLKTNSTEIRVDWAFQLFAFSKCAKFLSCAFDSDLHPKINWASKITWENIYFFNLVDKSWPMIMMRWLLTKGAWSEQPKFRRWKFIYKTTATYYYELPTSCPGPAEVLREILSADNVLASFQKCYLLHTRVMMMQWNLILRHIYLYYFFKYIPEYHWCVRQILVISMLVSYLHFSSNSLVA